MLCMHLACTRDWQAFLLKKVVEVRGTNKLFAMGLWRFDLLAGVAAALRFFALSASEPAALAAALGSIIVKIITRGKQWTASAIQARLVVELKSVITTISAKKRSTGVALDEPTAVSELQVGCRISSKNKNA